MFSWTSVQSHTLDMAYSSWRTIWRGNALSSSMLRTTCWLLRNLCSFSTRRTVCSDHLSVALYPCGPAMYSKLTPQWAGICLSCSGACIPIPFVFYKWEQNSSQESVDQANESRPTKKRGKGAAALRRQRRKDEERGEKSVEVSDKPGAILRGCVRRIATLEKE